MSTTIFRSIITIGIFADLLIISYIGLALLFIGWVGIGLFVGLLTLSILVSKYINPKWFNGL